MRPIRVLLLSLIWLSENKLKFHGCKKTSSDSLYPIKLFPTANFAITNSSTDLETGFMTVPNYILRVFEIVSLKSQTKKFSISQYFCSINIIAFLINIFPPSKFPSDKNRVSLKLSKSSGSEII
jgi:hypothetical protein